MNPLLLAGGLGTRISYDSYYTAKYQAFKVFYNFTRELKSNTRETVIVYQMGKVGSTTVFKSLRTLKNVDVYHVHTLTRDGIEKVENMYKNNSHRTRNIYEHLLESQYLRNQLDKGLEGKNKWKVVTLVRDPIAKNISSFFHHLETRLGYEYKTKKEVMKIEDIIEELTKRFLRRLNGHENSLTWFERELKPVFGIDVYSRAFPKSKGYEIYESEYADVLVLRLENLNECGCDAFKNFLDLNEFNLVPRNVGNNKSYRDIYQGFLDSIVLPDSYIEKMYTSKYVRHFYSEEETEAFKAKWRS